MTLQELLQEGVGRLKAAGVPDASYDAWALLGRAFGRSKAELLAELPRELCGDASGNAEGPGSSSRPGDCEAAERFKADIGRRALREPLQHILGEAGFMGLSFAVSPSVLIPRQDTETLVETVLSEEREKDLQVLDLCTGSGCIAIALKKLGAYRSVTGTDIDAAALAAAGANALANRARVRFLEADLFEGLSGSYDVIVSNPPYIPTGEIGLLAPEVRDFDPRKALDGGGDGLLFYRRILKDAPRFLKPGGRIYLEIGWDQAQAVGELLEASGFSDVRILRDLAGRDRVAAGVCRPACRNLSPA